MTLCAVILMSGGVWADSKQGAYAGLGINFLETTATNNKNVITKRSATGTGSYGGYRFDLAKRSMLIDIEVNYWLFSGGTDSGNLNFESSRTVLVGLGKTLTKKIAASAFFGNIKIKSKHVNLGKIADTGSLYGVAISDNLTSQKQLVLRLSKTKTDNPFGTGTSKMISLDQQIHF